MPISSLFAMLTTLLVFTPQGAGASVTQLPTTGAEMTGIALLGLILIAVGIVLMRRRNRGDGEQ